MKKYVRVMEVSVSNEEGVYFCVSESEHEDYSEAKTVLTCDAGTYDFAKQVRWMICTKYGLTDGEYEHSYCDYSEDEYYDPIIEDDICETTETYTFEVEE